MLAFALVLAFQPAPVAALRSAQGGGQDDVQVIDGTEKDKYDIPVRDVARASKILKTKPREAIETLSRVLQLDLKVERRVKFDLGRETYTRPYDFFPHRFRGEAHAALAEEFAGKREYSRALEYLDLAIQDFRKSSELGHDGSKPLATAAEKRVKEIREEKYRVDLNMASIVARLLKSLEEDDPDLALADVEFHLKRYESKWDELPKETRRVVVTYRVVAAALRLFLKDKSVEQVADELKPWRGKLKDVGGPFDEESFGPKVREVLKRLSKE